MLDIYGSKNVCDFFSFFFFDSLITVCVFPIAVAFEHWETHRPLLFNRWTQLPSDFTLVISVSLCWPLASIDVHQGSSLLSSSSPSTAAKPKQQLTVGLIVGLVTLHVYLPTEVERVVKKSTLTMRWRCDEKEREEKKKRKKSFFIFVFLYTLHLMLHLIYLLLPSTCIFILSSSSN